MKPKIEIIELKEQILSEFNSEKDFYNLFLNHDLMMGRMISGSKGGYREKYPNHQVIFNANIIIKSKKKIWFGDVSFPQDTDKIQEICNELGEPLYILYEMDARFGMENESVEKLINKAVKIFEPKL